MTVTSVSSSDVAVHSGDSAPPVSPHRNQTVVRLDGECDTTTVLVTADALARAIDAGAADVVVDLSEVTFLCAATAGVLIGTRNILRGQSRTLTLRAPSRSAMRLLGVCGLVDLVDPRTALT